MRKAIAYTLIAVGIGLIGYARVKGVHMTEGEILAEFFPHFYMAVGLIIYGVKVMFPQE